MQVDPHQTAETGDTTGRAVHPPSPRDRIDRCAAGRARHHRDAVLRFSNEGLLRSEIRRLFQFLKSFGVTAIITGERGEKSLTRFGLEEYVADCVILLDHRITDQVSTRRLRVVKYRGSTHGANEYPFLIDEARIFGLPITSLDCTTRFPTKSSAPACRTSMRCWGRRPLSRQHRYLLSGTAGTGKTSFSNALARRPASVAKEFYTSHSKNREAQIVRNMGSIGIDLRPHLDSGLLQIVAQRPFLHGLEMHLVDIHKEIERTRPSVVIIDPISNFITSGSNTREVNAMLTRLVDFLKMPRHHSIYDLLDRRWRALEATEVGISSIIDVWLLVRDIELSGERNRGLYRAQGPWHEPLQPDSRISNECGRHQTGQCLSGPAGMLTGSARVAQESLERETALRRKDETRRKIAAARLASAKRWKRGLPRFAQNSRRDETEAAEALALEAEQVQRL